MYITLSYVTSFLKNHNGGTGALKKSLIHRFYIRRREDLVEGVWDFLHFRNLESQVVAIGSDRESKELKVFREKERNSTGEQVWILSAYVYTYRRANIESTMPDFPWATLFSLFWLLGLFFYMQFLIFYFSHLQ